MLKRQPVRVALFLIPVAIPVVQIVPDVRHNAFLLMEALVYLLLQELA